MALNVSRKHQCHHGKLDYNSVFQVLSELSDVKKVVRLKLQIQRTGLVLARHAEENALIDIVQVSFQYLNQRKKVNSKEKVACNTNNEIIESKPCSHCVEVMRSCGIRKVTYSTKSGDFVTESLITIVSQPSVGYRSVQREINIFAFYSTHTSLWDVWLKAGVE